MTLAVTQTSNLELEDREIHYLEVLVRGEITTIQARKDSHLWVTQKELLNKLYAKLVIARIPNA